MPRPVPAGECVACAKSYPAEVKHKADGVCAACYSKQLRAQRTERLDATKKENTVESAQAIAMHDDGARQAGGLAHLALRLLSERFYLCRIGDETWVYVRDSLETLSELTARPTPEQVSAFYSAALAVRETQYADPIYRADAQFLGESFASVKSAVANVWMLAQQGDSVPIIDKNDLDTQPAGVFLLIDGVLDASPGGRPVVLDTANPKWNMTHAVTLGWTREYAQAVIDLEWADTPKKIRDAVELLWERLSGLFEMVAYRFNVLNKGIDAFKIGLSGAGKSAAAYLLQDTFPGLVKVLIVPKEAWKKQKWSELNLPLSGYRVVIVDEAGLVNLSRDVITDLTQREVQLAAKYQQHAMARRMGSIVMAGHDWQFIDTDSQGSTERISQVGTGVERLLPDGVYELLQTPEARLYFSRKMLNAQVDARHVQDQGGLEEIIERGKWSGLDKFLYTALERVTDYGQKVELAELTNHRLLKAYGVSTGWLKAGFERSIKRVFYDNGEIPTGHLEREKDSITGIRYCRIRWGIGE